MEKRMTQADALALFDGLEPVSIAQMLGEWRGTEISTGHWMDGMLSATRWVGKSFDSAETVYPLVHAGFWGQRLWINPAMMPMRLASHLPFRNAIATALFPLIRPLVTTRRPTARLRMMMYRDKSSAAMIYDRQPVIDVFRKIDDDAVLGLMDMRGDDVPFFFRLSRL